LILTALTPNWQDW